jgi:hypothetical protein
MPIEGARELAALWGPDPVHPAVSAYQVIVDSIAQDLASSDWRYTNPPKPAARAASQPRVDLSLERDAWVRGCTVALLRRDSNPNQGGVPGRGSSNRGRAGRHRGHHASRGSHGARRNPSRGYKHAPGTFQVAEGRTPLLVQKERLAQYNICTLKYV